MGVHSGIMGGVARYDQSCSNPLSKSHIMLIEQMQKMQRYQDTKVPLVARNLPTTHCQIGSMFLLQCASIRRRRLPQKASKIDYTVQ